MTLYYLVWREQKTCKFFTFNFSVMIQWAKNKQTKQNKNKEIIDSKEQWEKLKKQIQTEVK